MCLEVIFSFFCSFHFSTMDIFNNKKIQWILRQNIGFIWGHNCPTSRNSQGSQYRLLGSRVRAQEPSWGLALARRERPRTHAAPRTVLIPESGSVQVWRGGRGQERGWWGMEAGQRLCTQGSRGRLPLFQKIYHSRGPVFWALLPKQDLVS